MTSTNPSEELEVIIRPGKESDCDTIMSLIKELAVYERMPDQVKTTSKDLLKHAFQTTPPLIYTLVAELSPPTITSSVLPPPSVVETAPSENKNIVGYAIYYKTYWLAKGKAIHLEDLYVRSDYRFKGVGQKFLKYLSQLVIDGNYTRISFECVDWNEPALKFYRKHGAKDVTAQDHWHSYRFEKDVLQRLANE